MNITVRTAFALCATLSFLFISACRNKEDKGKSQQTTTTQNKLNKKDYLSLIISFDTLSSFKIKKIIFEEDSLLSSSADKDSNPYYHYFKARKYSLEKKRDSALIEYQKIKPAKPKDDLALLKTYGILTQNMGNGSMVESAVTSQIFAGLEIAEETKSRITYRFYDLLAQAYFQNQNAKKSLEYAAIYFQNHPYNHHPAIKQRYFDISFLLASRLGDFKKMAYYNNQARLLANQINDSLALARTYDNEAQIYSQQGKSAKALESSKIYFNYLKKTDNLNDIAFNNLATSFNKNNQPDSAIRYYKEGIAFEKRDLSGKQKNVHYKGLIDSYKMKGDFVHALEAAEAAHAIELKNNAAIEAVKVAEMHEKYETEKKDQNIAELKGRNKLNETIIKQQRSSMFLIVLIFLGVISFFFIIYRQQRLREKNKLLKSDNQRLNMEQKMLQAQLNPHFIFNAIANLQSIVASGHIDESVRYLKSFSGLLRGILEQNRKDFIEIAEEITSLNNYIQLQQMRYAGVFDYQIDVDSELDLNETLIPPMLIQPFVENAIEHGFRNIAYKGLLLISFKLKNDLLLIEVEDNGSGLVQKTVDTPKKQSLAQIILKERFELLFKSNKQHAAFNIKDKNALGCRGVSVEITIPIIND
ncbi:histidine kinase [Pedobacter agri]|uniref:tetratricopeptide repeat-containing sensor histidine kinase n=1 Tax=Pedobacter agri TaxID=454586 RepID=UPI0029307156|nr:histidine kinase [Pedobacter agri]